MENNIEERTYEMLLAMVNFGIGSKVLHLAKKYGISGGTIFLGKGTAHCRISDFLDICDERTELVLMIAQENKIKTVAEVISEKFKFHKPNHGIAITTSLNNFLGVRNCKYNKAYETRGVERTMYEGIFVVVDRGMGETVVSAAENGGANGATIINARGSGIHEYRKIFAMDIEPEKEIVMVITETKKTESIVNSILSEIKLDEPGKGIIFTIGINNTYGLFEESKEGKRQGL
ncbi:P-II family nitrogen regulator [Acetobacterium bakii]|uniref:Nitrogen regulatory protein P-II n=1 Tax=Acetobacterium bakii TaxID=52689 RepID=A0A0L6TXT2_9FIRM|nr:P-II family nitrogen regulator [Acetobacterium bakii]KNZ41076.1 nitrogen regulatory protein P-II [Acetobacterium bakii]